MFIVQLIVCVIVSAFAVVNRDLHVIQENYFSSYKSDYEGTLIRQHVHKLWPSDCSHTFRYERGILRTLLHEGSACNKRLDRGAEQL